MSATTTTTTNIHWLRGFLCLLGLGLSHTHLSPDMINLRVSLSLSSFSFQLMFPLNQCCRRIKLFAIQADSLSFCRRLHRWVCSAHIDSRCSSSTILISPRSCPQARSWTVCVHFFFLSFFICSLAICWPASRKLACRFVLFKLRHYE